VKKLCVPAHPRHSMRRASVLTIRSAALPSHKSGRLPTLPWPVSIFFVSSRMTVRVLPTRVFVPCAIVIGRSVFSRSVKHGTPRAVVSSWSPPLSVSTMTASFQRLRKSIYPSGPVNRTSEINAEPLDISFGSRVKWKDKRQVSRNLREGASKIPQNGWIIDVRGSV